MPYTFITECFICSNPMEGKQTYDALLAQGMDQSVVALNHRRRRQILLLLNQGHIDNQRDFLIRNSDESDQLMLDLTENHLPKLAKAGLIEWNPETGEIEKGPKFEEIKPLLEMIENQTEGLPSEWL